MLQELRVNNLALINRLDLDFSETGTGLIAFTGETGAGKSIILQAVHLLTGGRASASWVRNDCDQAVIEAQFGIKGQEEILTLLQEHGLENEEDCILRRIVSSKGRSRIFINDRLATTKLVNALAESLVNIASQHDQQLLLKSNSHINFLDSYGELWEQREQYRQVYSRWQKLARQLRELQTQEQDKEQRREFLNFQLKEIRETAPLPGEDEQLIKERDLLKSSTTLAELVGKSHYQLQDQIIPLLTEIRKNMEHATAYDPALKELSQQSSSLFFEVEDLEGNLRNYLGAIPRDQGRMEQISSRLAQLRQLQRKYGTTLEEVLEFAEQVAKELNSLDNLDEKIAALEKELHTIGEELQYKAEALSQERLQVAEQLTAAMQAELGSLSFRQALFEVSVSTGDFANATTLSATGGDTVSFLFSANPGEPPKPLTEVVSGGELSRLMLAMKCLLARRDKVDTVIFDEIDAGIGGEAAEAVARKIDELAGHHQVFCITHLPQIAAYADAHFLVEKQVDTNRTFTTIRELSYDERVHELARMLGGDNPSEQTLIFAKELVEGRADKTKR
ncbi:MAG: DNA repair protein RecN [Candidatus Electrothrix aestuarii]|uniref:DNA repair protein RecN n=1 Tax=Candidatus Electrothrix aestuarii TaxID=3062594 RepID=A0AAU8LU56_9BACT|nr:DNA repair protein RecN [Candidatus Electrothrix aestuarii]